MKNKHQTTFTNYQWTGINRDGEKIKGMIQSSHLILAKHSLHEQGVLIKTIRKQRKRLIGYDNKKIKQTDITVFTRQLATLISAGVPLVQSFEIIAKAQTKQRLEHLIKGIKQDIETGLTLADSLRKYPTSFNKLFCNLVHAGEKSGSLEIMLHQLAAYQEKMANLKKKINKALSYPLFVLIVAILVTISLLIVIVPQFATVFTEFGADLPILTQAIIASSHLFQTYGTFFLGLLTGVIYALIYCKKNSPQIAYYIDRGLLSIPLLGRIIKKTIIARFLRTLAITFSAGLPIVDALSAVSDTTGNILYTNALNQIRAEVSTGQQLQVAINHTQLFPNRVIQMIAIGEESGKLELMLIKAAEFYEEEVDHTIERLSNLLEPTIMVILGVLVGGLIIAMYLPIFQLGSII